MAGLTPGKRALVLMWIFLPWGHREFLCTVGHFIRQFSKVNWSMVGILSNELLQNSTLWGRGDGLVDKVLATKICELQIDSQHPCKS